MEMETERGADERERARVELIEIIYIYIPLFFCFFRGLVTCCSMIVG